MSRTRRPVVWAAVATATLLAGTALQNTAADAAASKPQDPGAKASDVRQLPPDYNGGKSQKLNKASKSKVRAQATQATAEANAAVGDQKIWLALDDATGPYLKMYTLRGLGDHIQVWVANDTAFPAGDCRNDLGLAAITDAQVNSFVHEFDTNIYPKESATFSVPPSLDGSGGADLANQLELPEDYWQVDAGQADDIVTLVDNVRDANFTDPGTPDGQTYIAGFFYSLFNDLVDRNIMTIDAYDWLHRTGATPPDDSADPAYVACTEEQNSNRDYGVSRPHLYEGTFAHEYQHLLESYESPGEESWINEGLSDWAQTLVGYVDPSLAPDDPAADGHLACFQGFLGEDFGGPENSLTEWQDQGGPEILCDYGAAYSFMEYLQSHYGTPFMTALHRGDTNGLDGLDDVLDQFGSKKSAMQTIHDWQAAMALDTVLGPRPNFGSWKHFDPWSALRIKTLNAKINWDTEQAFASPGAPPNGADYVRLRKANGTYFKGSELQSIGFDGATSLAPQPVEWEEAPNPPDATTEDTTCGAVEEGTGPAALYSGCGENLDRSIVQEVTVPSTDATLSFDALWDTEDLWDYGYVQVSTDDGATWTSLATEDTTSAHDPDAVAAAVDNLPGLTGDSGTWTTQHADLSAYAGQDVLIGFRYITDGGVNEGGFWVRNIQLGETTLPATLGDWKSITEQNPIEVAGFTVQLIGYGGGKNQVFRTSINLDGTFDGVLSGKKLTNAIGSKSTVVAALVTYDDPTESNAQYARYTLTANGVVQPGG